MKKVKTYSKSTKMKGILDQRERERKKNLLKKEIYFKSDRERERES